MNKFRTKLAALKVKQEKISNQISEFIIGAQQKCKHPIESIIEGEYRQSYYANADPPFRVCKECGFAERGWGCGYRILAPGKLSGVPSLPREEAYKYVIGKINPNFEE